MIDIRWKQRNATKRLSRYDNIYEKLAEINEIDNLDEFLNPDESHTHNPYLLRNIDKLANRIIDALNKEETITIAGDPDFDGGTSLVIMCKYLSNFTNKMHYVCNERSEGHSIHRLIDKIHRDTTLFIALDSSSNDIDSMKKLNERGIDCLIIDHHTITEDNPHALIVNPQHKDCKYPNKEACGGLLTFKVCQVIDDYMNANYSNELDDLPGLALMADMMSMREMENRYFASLSLKQLRHAGLKTLFKLMNFDLSNLSSTDFLYGVSPAVTAATRADRMQLAIDFLMNDTETPETKKLARELVKLNEERKEAQIDALESLKPFVNKNDKVVIVFDPTLGKGRNGLVAQEISKTYNKPAIVLGFGEDNDTYAGSFRGLEDFSMLELLNRCESVVYAAGHSAAGGVAIPKTHIDVLRKELNSLLRDFKPDNTIYYDLEFDAGEVNEDLITSISEFYRISGNQFTPGKFKITNLFVADKKLMGKLNNTVKIDCDNIQAMKFKTDEEYYNSVPVFCNIEAIGTLNINTWIQYKPRYKVNKYLQLYIDDYVLSN